MAAPVDTDLNPFAVAVAVAGALLGPKFAYYIGAYGLILTGWFGGLLYGLFQRQSDARMPVWAYALCTLTGSVGATVPTAELASQYLPISLTALLFPVAFAIPAAPDKWSAIGVWLLEKWQNARGATR